MTTDRSPDAGPRPPEPGRRRSRWRWVRRGLGGALLLAVALAATHAWWLPAAIERAAPWAAQRFLPFDIEVAEVEHAHAGRLAVRGLRLEPRAEGEALKGLRAARADVRYSLAQLARGDVLGALRSVELEDAELALDLDTPPKEPASEPGAPLELPAELPHLDVRGLDLRLELPGGRTLSARVESLATPEPGRLALDVRDLALEGAEPPLAYERVQLDARYEDRVFSQLELTVEGEPLLVDSRVDLRRIAEGELAARLDARLGGGELSVDGELGPDGLRAEVAASGVELGRMFARLPLEAPALDAKVDLEGRVALAPGGALLDGSAQLSLRASQVRLGDLELDSVELVASLAERALAVERLAVVDGTNEVLLAEGALDLAGEELAALDLTALLLRARARISARIDDPRELLATQSDAASRVLARTQVDVEARLAEGRLELERSLVDSPLGVLELERGFVELRADAPPVLDLGWRFDLQELARAAELFGLEGFEGRLAGSVEATGTWPDVRGATSLNGAGLVVAGVPLGELALVARYDAGRVELTTLRAQSLAQTLVASGAFDGEARAIEDGRLALEVRDAAALTSALAPGLIEGGSGRMSLAVEGPLESLRSEARVEANELRIAGLPTLDVDLAAVGNGRAVEVEALQVVAGELGLQAAGAFELGPELAPESVRVTALELGGPEGGLLSLREPTTVALAAGALRVGPLELEGALGRVRAEVRQEGGVTRAQLEVEELRATPRLAALLPEGLGFEAIEARFDLELEGQRLALESEGGATALSTPALALPLDLGWDLSLRDERLELRALSARGGEVLELDLFGELPLAPTGGGLVPDGELSLRGQLVVDELAALRPAGSALPPLSGGLVLDLELGGRTSRVEGSLALRTQELALALNGAGELALGQLAARVGLGDAIVLAELALREPAAAPGVELRADGTLDAPLDLGALAADPRGWLASTPLDLEAALAVPELELLLPLFERLGLGELPVRGGRLSARVDLEGTLERLERSGRAELREGIFRLGGDLPTAALVDANILLSGERVTIERGSGELGGAPFSFSGEVDLGAQPLALELELSGEDLLLYRARGIKVRADADLAIEGPLDALVATGRLSLADARYARNFEVDLTRRGGPASGARGLSFFRLSDPPLADMRFDVKVDAREPFRIATTTVSGAVRPDLRLIGTGEVPVVTGAIYVDPTTISLPGSSLRIESGTIQFREEDPFMPRLALRGGTRLRGYDITLVVQGTLAEPEILLSSNPPLPDDQLLLLVTTGQVPVDGEAASASDTARVLAVYLAKDFLARWLSTESTESEESLLNRFEVIAGQDVSRSGADTIWVSFRVAEDLVSTRDKLFLTAERDLFDQFNYGVRIVFRFP